MAPFDADTSSTTPDSPYGIALRNFGSIWFIIPQGTATLAVCFWNSDYQFKGQHTIALVVWGLAIAMILCMAAAYAARIIVFPKHVASQLVDNNSELACIASLPVAFATVVKLLGFALGDQDGWSTATYVLWWIATGCSVLTVFIIPQSFATISPPGHDKLLPNSQLPIVAALTAAAAGGSICKTTTLSLEQKLPVVMVSFILVGIGVPLAIFMDTILLSRLLSQTKEGQSAQSRMQKQAIAYQTMIVTGPWGQSSVALFNLGASVLQDGLAGSDASVVTSELASKSIAYASIFIGLLFWGHATFWWAFSLWSIMHGIWGRAAGKRAVDFQLAVWAIVFPWGVYTNGTVLLGGLLDSTVFRVWAAILTIVLTIIWLGCMFFTIKGCVTGSLLGLEGGWQGHKCPKRSDRKEEEPGASGSTSGSNNSKDR